MFSIIISGEADVWETDQVMRMEMSRFKEFSGGKEADAVSLEQPETLGLLEKTPALLFYENGTECQNADVVRYGLVRDVQCNGHYVLFRFIEEGRIPKVDLKDFSSRLGLAAYELNRTHWALKEGGIPSGLLKKAEEVARTVVFISYSHTSEAHKRRVEGWAKRLEENRISVQIDLLVKLGQDLNSFMERMVSDAAISKVLVFSDNRYAQKADGRSGGVGTEAQILSPEVYARIDQTKVIPIVCEFEKGKPCLPIFLKSRKWLDFSTDEKANANFNELLDAILDKAPKLRSNNQVSFKYVLKFDLDASPVIADQVVFSLADELTYEAQKGLIPPAAIEVRAATQNRERLAALDAKPSLSPEDRKQRIIYLRDLNEAEEEAKRIENGLAILFSKSALKWLLNSGVPDAVALCMQGYFRWLTIVFGNGMTSFDIWRDDLNLSGTVLLSEGEVQSLLMKLGYRNVSYFTMGGHCAADFDHQIIVSRVYPRIIHEMSKQAKAFSESEIDDILNPMKWKMGLG